MELKELEIYGVIAFNGLVRNGLHVHPDGEHLVYPIGNKISIKHMKTGEQSFLTGHKDFVSALCISCCGRMVASGQTSDYGFKATVIIWDYEKRIVKDKYKMHKVSVQDVCFSENGQYLISLGGRDDRRLIVWDIENRKPHCGIVPGGGLYGHAVTIARIKGRETSFVTAGDKTFKLWKINEEKRSVHEMEVKVGKIKRSINCLVVDENAEFIYCGTTSGDIMKARLNIDDNEETAKCPVMMSCFSKINTVRANYGHAREVYAGGVNHLLLLADGKFIVGAGDGTIELIEITNGPARSKGKWFEDCSVVPAILTLRTANVCARVTSMVRCKNDFILVGTDHCEIYKIEIKSFQMRLINTSHAGTVYDVAFPRNCSDIFATSGNSEIRIWKLANQTELLRITVPNLVCTSLCFDNSGKCILSAWGDGAIRSFALNGGHRVFEISRAHTKSVSAITVTKDDSIIVSGGCDGQVRIWKATSESQNLLKVLKEHQGPITSIQVSLDNTSLISSSTDGTCILWDLRCHTRKFMLTGNTKYMAACFIPNGAQVLTCGRDRSITYWETFDGSLVRQVQGSLAGTLNALSVSHDGQYFLTGSDDCIVKLWEYQTANTVRIGLAHAAVVTACTFSSDAKFIISVSADGAIIIWKYPSSLETSISSR